MTTPDYRRIAEQANGILLSIGCHGLDPSKQRELWQRALDLDRLLHPSFPPTTVWTEEEGDIDPPRHADSKSAVTEAPQPAEPLADTTARYVATRVGSYVTASMVQRHVRVGFAKAASLLQGLADAGAIEPGSKGRYTVLSAPKATAGDAADA
jgi:hypothetical protein